MFMQRIHSEIQAVDKYPDDELLQKKIAELDYSRVEDEHFGGRFS